MEEKINGRKRKRGFIHTNVCDGSAWIFSGISKKRIISHNPYVSICNCFQLSCMEFLGDLSIVVLTIMIGITACIGFNTRLEGNISMRAFVLLFIAYLKEQQVYLYKYKDEWKVEE